MVEPGTVRRTGRGVWMPGEERIGKGRTRTDNGERTTGSPTSEARARLQSILHCIVVLLNLDRAYRVHAEGRDIKRGWDGGERERWARAERGGCRVFQGVRVL